nr:MAG TPA: hypothetical protein [Caudoviricetes sp.]
MIVGCILEPSSVRKVLILLKHVLRLTAALPRMIILLTIGLNLPRRQQMQDWFIRSIGLI